MLLLPILARINLLIMKIWHVSFSVRSMLYAVHIQVSHICIFVIWAVFIATQLAVKCTIAKVQTHDIQKKGQANSTESFSVRGSVAIPWFLLQWSDWHLCNSNFEKGEGELCKVSGPCITPDSILQDCMVRLDLCLMIICLMLCLADGVQNAELEMAPTRLFQGGWINYAEGWTQRKI